MPEDKPSFLSQVHSVHNIHELRDMLIQKERERQSIANDLDVAARLGLVISETNEAMQVKLAQLEDENRLLRQELELCHLNNGIHNASPERDHHHHPSIQLEHHEPDAPPLHPKNDRIHLLQELEQARYELKKFRNEMDTLSAQLNDMASEMLDSRAKVSMYAKRLAEVEHKLVTTREMNANLQLLLEKAQTNQKLSSSNTLHLVNTIQSDLAMVVAENDQLRAKIADLEHQQTESEEQLATMAAQAKKYESLLEQAQDTIHSLSESRLLDDDAMSNGLSTSSTVSYWHGEKETEITKGPVFSEEFKHEMQKEFERNLRLRNELRRRIITHETITSDRKKTQEGLKAILSDLEISNTTGMRQSTSTRTNSSTQSSSEPIKETHKGEDVTEPAINKSGAPAAASAPRSINTLQAASFLTGFNHVGSDSRFGGLGPTNFITRGVPSRVFTSARQDEPSISTRFFRRIATRLDAQRES